MVQIRRFEPKDAEAVKKLILEIMNGEFKEEKAAFSWEDLNQLTEAYGGFGEVFFVAEEDHEIIGTIGVKREDERIALIRRIFVDPSYRNKKIGYRLLSQAIEFCEEVGYRELVFKTTSRMTGSIELVKKLGFQARARVPMGQLELLKLSFSIKGASS